MPVTPTDIANCPVARRGIWLYRGFLLTEAAFGVILFPYLVSDYRGGATKKKALFIYDKCVFAAATLSQEMPTTIDLHSLRDNIRMSATAVAAIEEARRLRVLAQSMNWFKRVATSSERTAASVAGPNVFDELLAQHLDPSGKDNLWKDILPSIENVSSPRAREVYISMKKRYPATLKEIKDAGFSTANVGLDFLTSVFKG
jgi:hypothetical protein